MDAEAIAERLISTSQDEGSCRTWGLTPSEKGYGKITINGEFWYAHRLSYTIFKGPIPDGLQIDHLCRNPLCIKPAHLEAVTPKENTRRGFSPTVVIARRGTCDEGHPLTRNTQGQCCKICQSRWHRRKYEDLVGQQKGHVPFTQDPLATHCHRRGHPLEGDNKVILPSGRWRCMICFEDLRKYRESRKARSLP